MDNEKKVPLSLVLEQAKSQIIQSFNEVSNQSKLPAYLLEGIVLDVLSEIRNRKNLELLADISSMNTPEEKENKE